MGAEHTSCVFGKGELVRFKGAKHEVECAIVRVVRRKRLRPGDLLTGS